MKLPVMDFENIIIETVANNPVTVIEAETGAGKSTQIPQMLYMAGLGNVTITQPRVMAAISLANRVAEESGGEVGTDIGYKTRFYKTEVPTPITYVTDGYLLSSYSSGNSKEIVIIDEAHEFNIFEETLLGLYKKELRTNPNLKLVVMSATIDSRKISQFFNDAPIISVPGKLYPVEQLWEPSMRIEDCIFKYFTTGTNMLIFLPGKEEISKTYAELETRFSWEFGLNAPKLFQLHGEMTYEEQKRVFSYCDNGKIILATNVAQTSITVPDIDFVIDTGTCKEMVSHDGVSKLTVVNISQADCSQRAGRAGRCKPGTYVLCSSTSFTDRQHFSIPEIQRMSLENLVLKLATMNIDPMDIEFIHNPDRNNLKLAKELLVKIGAIQKNGTITKIGSEMDQMPVSARIARMLLEARKYSPEVQGDMAIIAALFECGDFRGKGFYYPCVDSEECKKSDMTYQLHIIKDMNARWHAASNEERKDFYKSNCIKFKIYQNILKVSKDIADKLGLKYMIYQKTNDEDFAKIRKCIISAYVDCIYIFSGYYRGPSYFDPKSYSSRQMDRNSVFSDFCSETPNFVLAQPMDIEVKDRFSSCRHTIALIKNATSVDINDNLEILDTLLDSATMSYRYDKNQGVLYDVWTICSIEIKRQVSKKKPEFVEKTDYWYGDTITNVVVDGEVIDILY